MESRVLYSATLRPIWMSDTSATRRAMKKASETVMNTHPIIAEIEKAQLRTGLPDFRVGDTVRVHYKIVEGDKERIQVFQGIVLKRHRAGARSTFTVRKMSFNVGVERVFLSHSPRIDQVEVVSRGAVRRARLFYLRDLRGKAARVRELGKA